MAKKKPDTYVFSPVRFGEYVRKKRRGAGYASTGEFSESIKELAGVYIDPDSLIKIERGEREPDISKAIAMSEAIARRDGKDRYEVMTDLLIASEPTRFFLSGDAPDELTDARNAFVEEFARRFSRDPSTDELLAAFEPNAVCAIAVSNAVAGGYADLDTIVDTLIKTLIYRGDYARRFVAKGGASLPIDLKEAEGCEICRSRPEGRE